MNNWGIYQLFTEATRNVNRRRIPEFLLFALLFGSVGIYVAASATQAVELEAAARSQGSLVWIAVARDGFPIASKDCQDVQRSSGVVASGGPRSDATPALSIRPRGREVPSVFVLPDTLSVWSIDKKGSIGLGAELIELQHLSTASQLFDVATGSPLSTDSFALAETVPVSMLRSRIVVPSAVLGSVSECWARFSPDSVASGRDVMSVALSAARPTITPFYTPSTTSLSPFELWGRDLQRYPAVIGGGVALLSMLLLLAARRSEIAIYYAFGAKRQELGLLLFFEALILGLPAAFLAAVATALWLLRSPSEIQSMLLFGAAGSQIGTAVLLLCGGAPIVGALMKPRNLMAWLKDR